MNTIYLFDEYIGKELNFSQICKIKGEEPKRGNGRKYQLKDVEQYYELQKHGSKYLFIKKYDKNEQQLINRHIKKEDYKCFKYADFEMEDMYKGGVYKIQKDNIIYIGKTNNFYSRLYHHLYSKENTKNLLLSGAKMYIIKIIDNETDRLQLEKELIWEYSHKKDVVCLNTREANEYKFIKIKTIDYKKTLDILQKNGIKYEI